MKTENSNTGIIIALLLAAGVAIWMNMRPSARKVTTAPHQAMAVRAANETVQLLGNKGHLRVISEKAESPAALGAEHVGLLLKAVEAQVEAFKLALKKGGDFTFASDWHLARGAMTMDPEWPFGAFGKLLQDLPEGAAVVSFAQLPTFSDEEIATVRKKKIRIILVGQGTANLQQHLAQRVVQLAVVYRRPVPPLDAGKTESPEEWVERVSETLKSPASDKAP
ncbi:MAG: hypothetical protein EXS29_06095 [Pedosphaera sp.]|nr:hypothetical protein [Pedosphaera sp.]